jgi:PAS domain S-box-containing protein
MTDNTDLLADLQLYKALLDNGIDIVTMIDESGLVLYQSPSSISIGYTPDEMVGSTIFDFLHHDDLEPTLTSFAALMQGEDLDRIIVRFKKKSGLWTKLEVVGRHHENQGKKAMILNSRDVTDHQEMLEKLRTSESLLSAAFHTTSSICSISDLETGELIDVNEAWTQGSGWSRQEALGKTAFELKVWGSGNSRSEITAQLRSTKALRQFPATFTTRFGEVRSVLFDVEVVELDDKKLMFLSGIDITEREAMESRLRQSQRLEAVGQLTGGIAHDLNNMLTVVLGQIDLTINRGLNATAYNEAMTIIRRATERGSDLIRQLMIFSRRQTLKPQEVDIAATIDNMLTLLKGSLGGEIKIATALEGLSFRGYVDEALLENALLNLALNARDAMSEGGQLTISAKDTKIDQKLASHYEIQPGKFVSISVKDDGSGMDEGILANAFEPFFTTKSIGQGSGLGLSMVFGFVKQSGGHIQIESLPGNGTTVTLYLPRAEPRQSTADPAPIETDYLSGKAVLLIEDNDELRDVLSLLLQSLDCLVIECAGDELPNLEQNIDLILSDVILPGVKQGPELASLAQNAHPSAKLVFMSGYPRDRFSGHELVTDRNLLKKPFSREALRQSLNTALSSG